jgi:CTD kinase subunit alpha
MRGGYPPQDRRFSGGSAGPPGPPAGRGAIAPTRGRGGFFQNLHWNANGNNRGGKATENQQRNPPPPPPPQSAPLSPKNETEEDDENPFRPSKDFRVEDQGSKDAHDASRGADKTSDRDNTAGSQSKESSKFSFAFKAKPAPPSAAKPPVPDLTQKMKEPPPPPRKDVFQENNRKRMPRDELPPPRHRDRRPDAWDDRRGEYRERDYEHRRPHERWDHPERMDRRHDPRMGKEPRPREKVIEKRLVKKIMKRPRQKPRLEAEFKASDSVYFRKGGNESVVGSGTYGKVYKGIHVFTKGLVALKKIRMEGERDGFPVTAVRELKLLQSLRHENVVSLLEVMVEKNDCFMVFEYLSHDLTGLLNHPTFQLEHAHKKDLARQLFQGLDYLHQRGVLHRDIKAANILVSNTGQLKLADFGLARFYAKRQQLDYTNRVITIWYRPPEVLLGETQYGPVVDVWSAACVMIEIFTKHAIFPGDGGEINQLEKVYNILGTPTIKEWPNLVEMPWFELLRPTERKPNVFEEKYKERLTPAAFDLLRSMLQFDPAKRPTASDVLEHPYFTTEEPLPRQAIE